MNDGLPEWALKGEKGMALYALGDLHISFQSDKSMDKFGKVWKNHEHKIEKYVGKIVKPEDTLVLTGDHSWGKRLSECREDLAVYRECCRGVRSCSGATTICSGMRKRQTG